jgi:pimeloyl-ACP methyl ester carboxylesterase
MTRVVFLHGLVPTVDGDPFVAALSAAGLEVFAPSLPGFADITDTDELRDVRDLALWADDTLEGAGLDDAIVIGHSFGGMVAAELAAHVPKRVRRLVLVDALGLWDDADPVHDIFRVFPLGLNDVLWNDPPAADADVLSGLVAGMTTVGKYLWPIPDKGLHRRLRRISADTLVLWGAKDRVASAAYADRFAAGIRSARVKVLDDAGHMLPYERTAEVVDAIVSFAG